jgi:ABC-2 type transport system permease protein
MNQAWAVSPLRMVEMTAARALFGLMTGASMTVLTILIVAGTEASWGKILLGVIASTGIAILISFLLGGFANTQLQMMAIMKVVLMVFSLLPTLAIFLPVKWHILFYPFPNYWSFLTFESIFIGQMNKFGFLESCGLIMGVTLIYILILLPVLKRKLRLQ